MNTNYKKWLIGQIEEELDNLVYDLDRLNVSTLELLWKAITGRKNCKEIFAIVKVPYQ